MTSTLNLCVATHLMMQTTEGVNRKMTLHTAESHVHVPDVVNDTLRLAIGAELPGGERLMILHAT